MLNFACLAASLLLTAGVGAGYVSTPTRHNAPQYVGGAYYAGFDSDILSDLNLTVTRDSEETVGSNELYVPTYAYWYPVFFGSEEYQIEIDNASTLNNVFRFTLYFGDTLETDGAYYWEDLNDTDSPVNVCVTADASYFDSDSSLDVSLLYGTPVYDGDVVYGYRYLISFNLNAFYTTPTWVAGVPVDFMLAYTPAYDGTNVTDAITDGLGAIVPMGGALVTGFDAIALDDGALTPVVTFGFVLMGLGISVGIVKKCFNWVTGRHGM